MDCCYIGTIMMFAGNYAPKDFAVCDGHTLKVVDYPTVYYVLGNKYGGDHQVFNLPNISSPIEGFVYIICVNGLFPDRSDI